MTNQKKYSRHVRKIMDLFITLMNKGILKLHKMDIIDKR